MKSQIYDISGGVNRMFRVLMFLVGTTQMMNGVINLHRGDLIFGIIGLAWGLIFAVSAFFIHHFDMYKITLQDECLKLRRSPFRERVLPWDDISAIRVKWLSLDIELKSGKIEKINFSDWSYEQNQTVKPIFLSDLKKYAQAKGIEIVE